jgi:hypothetical protein
MNEIDILNRPFAVNQITQTKHSVLLIVVTEGVKRFTARPCHSTRQRSKAENFVSFRQT